MKTKLIFMLLLIVCFSCGTNNKPVSDAQKEKIKGEVKEVVNTFFKGGEEVNFDMAIEPFLDSPDFVYIYNGSTLSYKDCVDAFKPLFSTQINQKFTIVDEKYAFLDNSTVLYTTNFKGISNFKDGHSSLADPVAMLLILKKIDNKWKIIYGVESSVEKNVPSETSKELNQVELMKQFLGNWKAEFGKDTIAYFDQKAYGVGQEVFIKGTSKGKMISEGKQLWGYDKKLDKIINSYMIKGVDLKVAVLWFISKNKYVGVQYSDISNPENASNKTEGEFISPDSYVETFIVNNNTVRTDTYTRVK
jgi:hydroxymethylpyrimidine pyrophosphatase-like HAD family hydrolase